MDVLKQRLSDDGVDYVEKVFATSDSIAGLRSSPFVSQNNYLLSTPCVHQVLQYSLNINVTHAYLCIYSVIFCRNLI